MLIVPQSVELVDSMGSDLRVVNAARVSFNKEVTELTEKDTKLIKYLATHNHWTPFAHTFLSFRIKAPIFVARQLVKHQIGLVWNEVSRRYVDTEPEFFFPGDLRLKPEGSVKQGSSDQLAPARLLRGVRGSCEAALIEYNYLIAEGVAPEQARMVLPLNTMTEWYWSGSLVAFARVCKLRLDPHAQAETREIARLINNKIPDTLQHSWRALLET